MDTHFIKFSKSQNLRFKNSTPGFGFVALERPDALNRGQGPFRPFEREFRVSLCYAAFFKRRLSHASTRSSPWNSTIARF